MYSFLFDRKSLILLVAGLATVGCLLFVAGLLTGVFWGPAAQGTTVSATPPAAVPAALFPAAEPCPPAAGQEANAEERSLEPPPGEPVPMLEEDARPRREPGAAERRTLLRATLESPSLAPASPLEETPAEAAPAALPTAATARLEAAPAASEVADPAPQPAARAALSPAPPAPVPAPRPAGPQPAGYFLQIGAFRQAENSDRIARDLQNRGYDAYVVAEKGKRPLRTVRVGRFTARDEALRAAQYFEEHEGVQVIVRQLASGAVPLTSW